MLKINRETDYGIAVLCLLAQDSERRFSAAELAEQRGLPQPMVSKVLKHLSKAGLVIATRGAKGGYGLARSPERITVVDIISALEGPIAITDCADSGPEVCQYSLGCLMSTNWARINDAVNQALRGITLKDMSQPLPALDGLSGFPLSRLTAN